VPLTVPNLDTRRYQDLLDEALARIPVYTPEWTNFNKSDPGVTLVEIFAFLTENLLYRCNQIPERNRKKFLTLLNIPLQPATSAQGLITITNESAGLQTFTFNDQIEVRAGQTPFRTTRGLDVLPIEGRIYFKQTIDSPSQQVLDYYQQLYASFRSSPQAPPPQLYQATSFPLPNGGPLQLSKTIDSFVWLALLARKGESPDEARKAIAGKTLSVGVVPMLPDNTAVLPSGRSANVPAPATLVFEIPDLRTSKGLLDSQNRVPQYHPLPASPTNDVFSRPGIVDVTLPANADELALWNNLDPLESGVDQLPPALDDTALNARLITWLRISPSAPIAAQFLWLGINGVPVQQREHVAGELVPAGTGEPDQTVNLSHAPVLAGSVKVAVVPKTATTAPLPWTEVDDLFLAAPEVPTPDPTLPPGSPTPGASSQRSSAAAKAAGATPSDPALVPDPANVFLLDAEAGQITFGDGLHGRRPPQDASLRATYDFSVGAAGNVGANSISTSPVLLTGFKVSNPIPTWGGADAETARQGEKQISRYLQHRDRLVTAFDFESITLRTPGVEIARVEVLPNFHPELSNGKGGDAPGALTVMLIPTFDARKPSAPAPTNDFLDSVCRYLDPRRLITAEVFLRGPEYVGIWVSIGIQVLPGVAAAPVREAVKAAILSFLAPATPGPQQLPVDPSTLFNAPQTALYKGWPLTKPVIALELMAVASRVQGVEFVQDPALLAKGTTSMPQVELTGLQLPQVLGISITEGVALPLDELRGGPTQPAPGRTLTGVAQVPVIPEECM
jgi:hypothetical protein